MTVDTLITLASELSPLERIQLVEQVMQTLADDLRKGDKTPKQDLYGMWSDVSISSDDIEDMRKTMWQNFPREDV
jgi:hypothetical protein